MRTAIVTFLLALFAGLPAPASAAQSHYDYPTSDRSDRDACIVEHGGVPGPDGAWDGVSRATLNSCQTITVWREGKWNWDARIQN